MLILRFLTFLFAVSAMLLSLSSAEELIENLLLQALSDPDHVDVTVVRRLLDEGHNPNVKNSAGWTPLIFATTSGSHETVQALINAGADIDEVENDLWSPVLVATFKNFEEIAVALIDQGANPLLKSIQGSSAFDVASARGQMQVLDAIERWRQRRSAIDDLNAELLDASLNGDANAISNLLAEGAEANSANGKGYSPLIGASRSGCVDCVRILLQAGADVNHVESDGWSPLTFASSGGAIDVINVLIENGADLLHVTKNGYTIPGPALMNGDKNLAMHLTNLALPEAMRVDDPFRLLELVESGADPNTKNPKGWTPLIYMTSRRDVRSVRRIIAAGADVNLAEDDGW